MMQQAPKIFEETVSYNVQKFFSNLHLPFTSKDPTCQAILSQLQIYFSNPKNFNEAKGIRLPFEQAMSKLNHAGEVPQTRSRLCGCIVRKNSRAYKCYQCITEENSILCLKCFDLERHQGHQFELITVFGGCCDCGDIEKWRPEGFCKEHSEDEHIEISIDPALFQLFIHQQHFALSIALYFYSEFQCLKEQLNEGIQDYDENQKKLISAIETKVRIYLEAYCVSFISQLMDFNSVGKYAHAMTEQLFESRPDLSKLPQLGMAGQTFFELLLGFQIFDKTPQKIGELFIKLFPVGDFKDKLTTEYVRRYVDRPDFPKSNYSHLSSQLFTSYIAISRLVTQRRIPPLKVNPRVGPSKVEEIAAQVYVRYYYDISYLSKLYGDASITYFTYHAQEQMIPQLCEYGLSFDPYFNARNFYGLEEIFVTKIVSVLRVAKRDASGYILSASLRQTYRAIVDNPKKLTNLFRPHERFFALLAFQYLQGELTRLEDEREMSEFLKILGVQNLEYEIGVLIQRSCIILSFAASLLENRHISQQDYTFYSYYFKKSHTLFSLDAILLKIAIAIARKHPFIPYSALIKRGDKLYHIVEKMETYSSVVLPIHLQMTTKDEGLALEEKNLKHFVSYIALLQEAVVSDLPILTIKCFLKPSKEEVNKHHFSTMRYQQAAMHYYSNILKSCDKSKIPIKQFKLICDLLFKEEEVFKDFVKAHLNSVDPLKLDADKSKGSPINLLYFKSASVRAAGLFSNTPLNFLPYFYPAATAPTVPFIEDTIVQLAKRAIDFTLSLEKEMQANQTPNYKSIVESCLKSVFNMVWSVFMQTQNPFIFNFLLQNSKALQFKPYLDHLSKDIKIYAQKMGPEQEWEEYQQVDNEQGKNQSLKKEKLSMKRKQMIEKMNKNKDFFLQEKSEKAEDDKELCCLCKEFKGEEENCKIAMLSQTTYNSWAELSPNNILYTFSSCGHEVHRSCYTKIFSINQIYSFCPLCKNPMNAILPLPHSNHPSQAHLFWQEFLRINRNFDIEVEMQHLGPIVFRSLTSFAVVKGLLFEEQFRKEVKVYRSLVGLLRYFDKVEGKEKLLNQQNEVIIPLLSEKSTTFQVFRLFARKLYQHIFNQNLPKLTYAVSAELIDHSQRIISDICHSSSAMEGGSAGAEVSQLRATVVEPIIQQRLSDLSSKHLGKCPNCQLVTNEQAICLICPKFVTCINCEKMGLMAHSQAVHCSVGVFIRTYTGEIDYIFRNRFWPFSSVFEDYMGRSFVVGSGSKEEFMLNPRKLQPYKEDIINNSIESRLRYNEKVFGKVYHNLRL